MDESKTKLRPYKFVELFAGCGGISLGLEAAGFELVFANELSGMAAETYCYNLIYGHEPPGEYPEDWYSRITSPVFKNGANSQVIHDPLCYIDKQATPSFLKQHFIGLLWMPYACGES